MARLILILMAIFLSTRFADSEDIRNYYVGKTNNSGEEKARDLALSFNSNGTYFEIDTRLKGRPVRSAMKDGYLLWCGTWRMSGPNSIQIDYRLLEAFRYKAPAAKTGNELSATFTIDGPDLSSDHNNIRGTNFSASRVNSEIFATTDVDDLERACREAMLRR